MTVVDDAVAELAADALRRDPVAVLDRLADLSPNGYTAGILRSWAGEIGNNHGPRIAVPPPGVAVLGCWRCGRVVDLADLRRHPLTDRRGRRLGPDRITCVQCTPDPVTAATSEQEPTT